MQTEKTGQSGYYGCENTYAEQDLQQSHIQWMNGSGCETN